MNSIVRRIGISLALVLAVLLGSGGVALAASGDNSKTFTYNDRYYSGTDNNGTFTGQVTYSSSATTLNPMAWSFRVSSTVRAISAGNMTCTTYLAGDSSYKDYHPNIPMDYLLHSTTPKNRLGQNQTLAGSCTFPVKNNGTAVLNFRFYYLVSDAGISSRTTPDSTGVLSTSLTVN